MKFLFASPHSLIDNTNGAAISVSTLLRELQRMGHKVKVFGATIYDTIDGAKRGPIPPNGFSTGGLFGVNWNELECHISPTGSWHRTLMTAGESEAFESHFIKLIDSFRPDVLILFGGFLLERAMLRESRLRGVRNVFYLANPQYHHSRPFQDVDVIVTDTASTAKHYKEKLQLVLNPVGKFIDKAAFLANQRRPKYITFINPSFEKGVSLVARLALMFREALPEVRFLIVESKCKWELSLKALDLSVEDFPNVVVKPHQSDMRQIYSETKLLLVPSFWHESGARVTLEAVINGIPVLAASHGGFAELLDESGFLVNIPASVRNKPRELVDSRTAKPWFDLIKRLLQDDQLYEVAVRKTNQVAHQYSLRNQAIKFLEAISVCHQSN